MELYLLDNALAKLLSTFAQVLHTSMTQHATQHGRTHSIDRELRTLGTHRSQKIKHQTIYLLADCLSNDTEWSVVDGWIGGGKGHGWGTIELHVETLVVFS